MTNPKKSTATKTAFWVAGLCLAAALSANAGDANAGDFSVKDMQGKTHRLADYRGKWVLVNFWATWCSPCLSEIPDLNGLHDAHKDLVVMGVAMMSGTNEKVADFVAAHHMRYPVVMGTSEAEERIRSAAGQEDPIEVLPSSYLFGPKGELVYDQAGALSRNTIEKILQRNKAKGAPNKP